MEIRKIKQKKGVMNEVVSVAILVLVVSVLFGLTFLFVSSLKDTTRTNVEQTYTVTDESGAYINETGYTLAYASSDSLARSFTITEVVNASEDDGTILLSGNYTLSTIGVLTNASETTWDDVNVSYTYASASAETAYQAVNDTESAGATIVDYLPLVFLSLIFGAILTLVLKIILPYVSLGRQVQGF